MDETSWKQGKEKAWLWVAVTQWVTVFSVARSRCRGGVRGPNRAIVPLGGHFGPLLGLRRSSAGPATVVLGAPAAGLPGDGGELLKVEEALWTFATSMGVEPTNNAAERALRHAVCGRKTSHGTNSAGGSRYVERMLTVVGSCRQQERGVLAFLTDCVRAERNGSAHPSLLPVTP